jgi:hypothetical protein
MHITSFGTKEADPNSQQPRYELFRVRIACVLTSSTDFQLTLKQPRSKKSFADHIRSNRKCMTSISNIVLTTLWMPFV